MHNMLKMKGLRRKNAANYHTGRYQKKTPENLFQNSISCIFAAPN